MVNDQLLSTLEDEWPPQNVRLTCDKCGKELLNVRKSLNTHPRVQPHPLAGQIETLIRKHRQKTGHTAHVDIDKQPEMKEEIDVEINVGEVQ